MSDEEMSYDDFISAIRAVVIEKCHRDGFDQLNEAEQAVYCLARFSAEVESGGLGAEPPR